MSAAPDAPSVSVIIPTFNRAPLLAQAIDSALAQTSSSFEVIVVDDGSTDNTEAVVRTYGDRVRYIATTNGGVAHARNVGTAHARGQYLTFLDSDDRLYPYALELLASLLDRFPDAGLVCAELSGFDAGAFFERYHLKTYHRSSFRDPDLTYSRIYQREYRLGDVVAAPVGLLQDEPSAADRHVYLGNVFDTYLERLILSQNTVMFRRTVITEAGERNVRVRHWQEVDYLLRITRRQVVCFVDVPTYQLRYHAGQISEGGARTWLRKQRILLRVVRRHAEADPAYYSAHRERLDRQLAHLHRAVAVPLLVQDVPAAVGRRYARRARVYLARAARYGHPAPGIALAARVPPVAGRFIVSVVERLRRLRESLARPHATVGSGRSGGARD